MADGKTLMRGMLMDAVESLMARFQITGPKGFRNEMTPDGLLIHDVTIWRLGDGTSIPSALPKMGMSRELQLAQIAATDEAWGDELIAAFDADVADNRFPRIPVGHKDQSPFAPNPKHPPVGRVVALRRDGKDINADLLIFEASAQEDIEAGRLPGMSVEMEYDLDTGLMLPPLTGVALLDATQPAAVIPDLALAEDVGKMAHFAVEARMTIQQRELTPDPSEDGGHHKGVADMGGNTQEGTPTGDGGVAAFETKITEQAGVIVEKTEQYATLEATNKAQLVELAEFKAKERQGVANEVIATLTKAGYSPAAAEVVQYSGILDTLNHPEAVAMFSADKNKGNEVPALQAFAAVLTKFAEMGKASTLFDPVTGEVAKTTIEAASGSANPENLDGQGVKEQIFYPMCAKANVSFEALPDAARNHLWDAVKTGTLTQESFEAFLPKKGE